MVVFTSNQLLNIIGVLLLNVSRLIVSFPIVHSTSFYEVDDQYYTYLTTPMWSIIAIWGIELVYQIIFAVEQSREKYRTINSYIETIRSIGFLFFVSVIFCILFLFFFVSDYHTVSFAMSVIQLFWCSFGLTRCFVNLKQDSTWERLIWKETFGSFHASSSIFVLISFTFFLYSIGKTFVRELYWAIIWVSVLFVVQFLVWGLFFPEPSHCACIIIYLLGLIVQHRTESTLLVILCSIYLILIFFSVTGSLLYRRYKSTKNTTF